MPHYAVSHSYPLASAQREDLAKRITELHCSAFKAPAYLVNVSFHEIASVPFYTSGYEETGRVNFIRAHVRTGPARTKQDFDRLNIELDKAWTAVIGESEVSSNPKARLGASAILGGVQSAYEQGFIVPEPGEEEQWFKENLEEFKKRASAGDKGSQEILEYLKDNKDYGHLLN